MRLKTIEKADVKGKRVLVRVDFNVAVEDGVIEDDFRIKQAIPTLRLLIHKKAKIILLTHFGKAFGYYYREGKKGVKRAPSLPAGLRRT